MKKLIIALSMASCVAFCITPKEQEEMNKIHMKILEEKGLPTPGSGIKLVPQNKMRIPKWKKQQDLDETQEINTKGFVAKNSDRAFFLIHIEKEIEKSRPMEAKMHKGYETHLRQSATDMPFAYDYVGVPHSEKVKFFGIAPSGAYVREPQSGWTGAIEFFKTAFGYCAYTESNLFLTKGSGQIAEELVSYGVNGKITLIDAEGSESSGFMVRVTWFDSTFNRKLECANMNYSRALKTATLELAKHIDSAY